VECTEGFEMMYSLPEDIEQQLAARAAARQTTPQQLVIEVLTSYLQRDGAERHSAPSGQDAVKLFRELQQAAAVTPKTAECWRAAIR
jgi:hypothetical protein